MNLRNRTQTTQRLHLVGVGHTTVLDVQGQVPTAILALLPAVTIALAVEGNLARRLKAEAATLLDLAAETIHAHAFHGVLQTRMTTTDAIAQITLRGQHTGSRIEHMLKADKTQLIGQTREGGLVAMGGAHAATGKHVKADQLIVFDDRDKAQVVGVNIHVIVRRNRHRGFELARQVGLAVQRIDGIFTACYRLFVQPDLVIGARARQQVLADATRPVIHLGMHPGLLRQRVAHDVAVDIAAAADRVDQDLVQLLNQRLHVGLENAVVLESLAGGQTHRAIAQLLADLINGLPLLGAAHAARQARTQHEAVVRLEKAVHACLAHIAIILLVKAVELADLYIGLGDGAGQAVGQTFTQGAAQALAVDLDDLVFVDFRIHQ